MNKKVIVGSMISFIAILSFTAIYIGSRLSETPSTAPETSKAFIDDETKIDYQFYGANGTCSLVRKNNTLCLQYTGSYNQFSKHWCHGDWGDNGSGCSCPASGYGSGAGKCATNYSPKPGLSFPGEDPKCFDGQFGIQNCNPEIYFNHSNTYPDNYADTVCLDKSWCEFQQIDILVGSTGNYTCFLSGYMGGTDVCNASPTPKPSNTPTITPTTPLTITPTVTKTITPTNTLTITGTLTVTPSVTHTITPTITQTITSTPIITPTITIIVTTPPASITVTTIPKTALISDTVDMTIIGIILIIFGSVIYGSGYYLKLGNGFWEKAGGRELWESSNNIFTQTKTTIQRVIKNSKEAIYNYFHDDKTAYEKKVIKDRKSKSN